MDFEEYDSFIKANNKLSQKTKTTYQHTWSKLSNELTKSISKSNQKDVVDAAAKLSNTPHTEAPGDVGASAGPQIRRDRGSDIPAGHGAPVFDAAAQPPVGRGSAGSGGGGEEEEKGQERGSRRWTGRGQ